MSEIRKRLFFSAVLPAPPPRGGGISPVGRCCTVISRPIFFFFNFTRDEERKVCEGSENAIHSPDSENCLDLVLIASKTVL